MVFLQGTVGVMRAPWKGDSTDTFFTTMCLVQQATDLGKKSEPSSLAAGLRAAQNVLSWPSAS